jgi:Protein of unknown function (DUF3455)
MTRSTMNAARLVASIAITLALPYTSTAQPRAEHSMLTALSVPVNIQVRPGNSVYYKAHAVGTQNYICVLSGWTLLGPQATLFLTFPGSNADTGQQVATHFLSANPQENGTPRPTWQGSFDTSAVWGKAIAVSTDPNFVAPGAIPWLLVDVVGSQRGPTGGSSLSETTFIQRVNTSGGAIPTTACTVGNVALVPYTADYYFYRADR